MKDMSKYKFKLTAGEANAVHEFFVGVLRGAIDVEEMLPLHPQHWTHKAYIIFGRPVLPSKFYKIVTREVLETAYEWQRTRGTKA